MRNEYSIDCITIFAIVAQAILIILKLTGMADIPWLWVLLPLWGGGIVVSLLIIAMLIISALVRKYGEKP